MASTSESPHFLYKEPIYPTQDEAIEPEHARFLYEEHCAILVVENLPVGSEFGIDLASFMVGDKFKGVKLIPPGVHFVFASAVDREGKQSGPRCGFYHNFKTRELLIKRWSTNEEDFDDSFEPDHELGERYSLNLRDLDQYLGAYRYSTYQTYLSLTDRLTPDLVQELVPINKKIRSVTFLTRVATERSKFHQTRPQRRTLRTDDLMPSEENLLPELGPANESVIRFTKLPPSYVPDTQISMTSSMITEYNMDSTLRLEKAFGFDERGQRRLIAEFQFAFVTLILGHVYDCFKHWRDILILVCSSDSAIVEHPQLMLEFAKVLQRQFSQVSREIFDDISHMDNLIRHHLDILIQNVQQTTTIHEELQCEVENLRKLAETKFGWIFEIEPDDERPVVVDL